MRGQAEESPINLYSYVLRNKPIVEKFPNLCLLIEFMFDISVSNASVERIIAIMKIIKNSQRLCRSTKAEQAHERKVQYSTFWDA